MRAALLKACLFPLAAVTAVAGSFIVNPGLPAFLFGLGFAILTLIGFQRINHWSASQEDDDAIIPY